MTCDVNVLIISVQQAHSGITQTEGASPAYYAGYIPKDQGSKTGRAGQHLDSREHL